jgi:hypothetical protein
MSMTWENTVVYHIGSEDFTKLYEGFTALLF